MCRDPQEQEQPRLPRRAPVLPLPLLAARIQRDPPEVHHHAEQDQVGLSLILEPDFSHHSLQTSDIYRHALEHIIRHKRK